MNEYVFVSAIGAISSMVLIVVGGAAAGALLYWLDKKTVHTDEH